MRAPAGAISGRMATRRTVLSVVHVAVLIALAMLVLTWIVGPRSPSRFFRIAMLAGLGLWTVVLMIPPTRRLANRLLDCVLRPLTALALGGAVSLLLAEVALRVIAATSSSPIFAPIDATASAHLAHWRGKPGQPFLGSRLNAQGFFDTDFAVERAPGARRIVALADSFGPGVVPLAQNFLTLLDDRLDATTKTEVLNFGVPAINPGDYLHLWNTEAVRYDPDLVLVCIFVGNDFDVRKSRSILHADSMMSVAVVKRLLAAKRQTEEEPFLADHRETFTKAAFLELERGRLRVCERDPSRKTRRRYQSTLAVLAEMHQTIGAKLRVVVIPDEFQVNDALWRTLVGDSTADYDRERPQRTLVEFFRSRNVPCLDLLPALRRAEPGGRTYKPRDTHWNARGNRVAADEIARWLGSPAE